MANKKEEQPRYTVYQQSELPTLWLVKSKMSAGHEVDRIELISKGMDIDQAGQGINFLLKKIKQMK